MTSQPDKFFRDKLENFSKPAPVAAWDKIEANIDKTYPSGLWMKIAAGIALLAVAAILLWPANNATNSSLLTDSVTPKAEVKNKNSIPESISTVKESPSATIKENVKEKAVNSEWEKPKDKKEETHLIAQNISNVLEEENQVTIIEETPSSISDEVGIQSEVTNKTTSKTIVYTADEVNSKFLKKVSPAEATFDEKKSSSLQKLMGLAYNLKNTETGLGDLRQKKNEILALNFRDKKEGQN